MLNLLSAEVLPAPYQEVTHCMVENWFLSAIVRLSRVSSYQWEIVPKEVENPFIILSRWRHIVLNERHVDELFGGSFFECSCEFYMCYLAILDQRLIASMRSLYSKSVRATHPFSALHETRFSSTQPRPIEYADWTSNVNLLKHLTTLGIFASIITMPHHLVE